MTRLIWTTMVVGGTMSPDVAAGLAEAASDYFQNSDTAIHTAFAKGEPATFEGETKGGKVGGLKTFCRECGLAYIVAVGSDDEEPGFIAHVWWPGSGRDIATASPGLLLATAIPPITIAEE